MNIVIDLGELELLVSLIPSILFWAGVLLFFWYILRLVNFYLKDKAKAKKKKKASYVCLSIDVSKNNKQGPEAVERMFAHLAGIGEKENLSLEIAGIEGEIQFFIYAPTKFRDLVEAAVYTAYPSAEIFAVEDYTKDVPEEFPNDKMDVWAADLKLSNPSPYPIRTYPEFEHKFSKELKDPMIDLLEFFGQLRHGEQVWMQFIIKPIGKKLKKKGDKLIKTIQKGGSSKKGKNIFEVFLGWFLYPFQEFIKLFVDIEAGGKDKDKDKKTIEPADNKKSIKKIQEKISKIAFDTKISLIYVADKQVFNKERGMVGILSALNAFNTLDLNGFEIDKKAVIKDKNFRPKKWKNAQKAASIISYKKRSRAWKIDSRWKRFLNYFTKITTIKFKPPKVKKNYLNIEELATLYHLPTDNVNAPLVRKTGSKRGQPPVGLPTK